MSDETEKESLYCLQEHVLSRLQSIDNPQLAIAKLCGGTALSRCWLDHRISYDLDFFFPEGFKARDIAVALKMAGISYETKDLVDDPRKANQLHGYVVHQAQQLKVSFVEDAYFDIFPPVVAAFGAKMVRTEEIQGLYHRKLRTVAGSGSAGESFEGGRQTARDLFDLHVLSVKHMPLREFMESLPYQFPVAAFENGLANMPWFELMDELGEIVCPSRWRHAKDVVFLQNALYSQLGATLVLDEWVQDAVPEPAPEPASKTRERGRKGHGPGRGGISR
ncbi:MAG: nucleotidyl transferase AbiEii/AbiGii toxin family protein [Rhodoferax sp.]|nr:nucleotidyl transferase AbiEii/AbiGii toxin family protein [Rhodoferax sp.]